MRALVWRGLVAGWCRNESGLFDRPRHACGTACLRRSSDRNLPPNGHRKATPSSLGDTPTRAFPSPSSQPRTPATSPSATWPLPGPASLPAIDLPHLISSRREENSAPCSPTGPQLNSTHRDHRPWNRRVVRGVFPPGPGSDALTSPYLTSPYFMRQADTSQAGRARLLLLLAPWLPAWLARWRACWRAVSCQLYVHV